MTSISAAVACIPKTECKNVKNADNLHHMVQEKQLGADALADTDKRCRSLFAKARRAVCLFGTDEEGVYTVRWHNLSLRKKVQMKETLVRSSPWLRSFEDEWVADWLLGKFVDQRVVNGQSKKKKAREAMEATEAAGRSLDLSPTGRSAGIWTSSHLLIKMQDSRVWRKRKPGRW